MADRPISLVTGSSSGIGTALAAGLAEAGHHVIMHGRDEAKGTRALVDVRQRAGHDDVDLVVADLSVRAEVERLAEHILARYPRLDVLVHNAGLYHPQRHETVDGIEETFAVNHLAPFLLTQRLLPLLEAAADTAPPARIVTTASRAHQVAALDLDDLEMERRKYRGWTQYANTKLMNILWTQELGRRLDPQRFVVHCFHPGIVRTRLARDTHALEPMFQIFGRSIEKGADTGVWLATAEEPARTTGGYWARRRRARRSKMARDQQAGERLWAVSERQSHA